MTIANQPPGQMMGQQQQQQQQQPGMNPQARMQRIQSLRQVRKENSLLRTKNKIGILFQELQQEIQNYQQHGGMMPGGGGGARQAGPAGMRGPHPQAAAASMGTNPQGLRQILQSQQPQPPQQQQYQPRGQAMSMRPTMQQQQMGGMIGGGGMMRPGMMQQQQRPQQQQQQQQQGSHPMLRELLD